MRNLDLTHAVWRKATASGAQSECVEIADLRRVVAVRDSKNPDGPKLAFTRREWRSFAERVAGL